MHLSLSSGLQQNNNMDYRDVLVLLDRKLDEDEDYVILKSYNVTQVKFKCLCCITYMGVLGPSLLIVESTESMIIVGSAGVWHVLIMLHVSDGSP